MLLLLCPLLLCGSPNYNVILYNYRLIFYYISHHKTHLYELFERERGGGCWGFIIEWFLLLICRSNDELVQFLRVHRETNFVKTHGGDVNK